MLPQPEPTARELFENNWPLVQSVVRWVCQRHGLRVDEAEEFAAHTSLRLIEDDFGVMRKFRGRSSLRTYLTTVITRLFLDYRTSLWGKWRPSAAAKRSGPMGVRLDRLMFRDGCSPEEAVNLLANDPRVVMSREELTVLAARLPAHNPRRGEMPGAVFELLANDGADAQLIEHELERVTLRVRKALLAAFQLLPAEDRLLLRMRFRDDLSVARISVLLRLEAKGLYRRIHRLLLRLQHDLMAQGITHQEVAEVLSAHGAWLPVVVQGGGSAGENPW